MTADMVEDWFAAKRAAGCPTCGCASVGFKRQKTRRLSDPPLGRRILILRLYRCLRCNARSIIKMEFENDEVE